MTHDERLIPLLSEWLEGQPDRAPSRLLDVVLTDLQSTPQSARWQLVLRRFPMLTSTGARYFAVAAVAVLAVVIVGGLWAGRPGGVGAPPTPTSAPTATSHTPSPTLTATSAPTPSATLTPSPTDAAVPLPEAENLEPGRYFLESAGYRFTFTVGNPGWSGSIEGSGVYQGSDEELAIFWPGGDIPTLYSRACEWSGTEFNTGPSVNGLATALASLEDFESTAPADVNVSGYGGRRVSLTVPMDVDFATCDEGNFHRDSGRHYQANGQTDDIYVLNISGNRQTVVVSHTPDTPAGVQAQLEEMLNSLEIKPI